MLKASGLDLSSVMRACQIISSEIDLQKLLTNMMKLIIQNAGAQKGYFIVPDDKGTVALFCL